jgi:hypothetical protein
MPTPEMRFGDVVFPYGPFGFVLSPTYTGGKAVWALAVQWILLRALGGALCACGVGSLPALLLRRGRPPGGADSRPLSRRSLGAGVVLLVLPAASGFAAALAAGRGGCGHGFALLTKVSVGLGALSVLVAYAIAAVRRSPEERAIGRVRM